MKYYIENRNKFMIVLLSIIVFVFLTSLLWILEVDMKINLYFLMYMFIPISIYTFFTHNLKLYKIFTFLLISLWAFCMQTLSAYGVLYGVYGYESFYYFLLFFIIFYIFWIIDFIKISKLSTIQSKYMTNMIRKFRKEKKNNYFINEEELTKNRRKYKSPIEEETSLMNFYTGKITMIIGLPIILFGKLAIAIGILSARYFPNSNFIFFAAMFILGTIFFTMGIMELLTYLKLDLSEEEKV